MPPGGGAGGGGGGVKNLSNGWSKSIVLENKVVLNFDFRHGAKNQVISTTSCKELAKCILYFFKIYFDILGYLWPTTGTERNAKTPSKKGLSQKM